MLLQRLTKMVQEYGKGRDYKGQLRGLALVVGREGTCLDRVPKSLYSESWTNSSQKRRLFTQ